MPEDNSNNVQSQPEPKKKKMHRLVGRLKGAKEQPKGISLARRLAALKKTIKDPNCKEVDRISAIRLMTDLLNDRIADESKENTAKTIFSFEEIILEKKDAIVSKEQPKNEPEIEESLDNKQNTDIEQKNGIKSSNSNSSGTYIEHNIEHNIEHIEHSEQIERSEVVDNELISNVSNNTATSPSAPDSDLIFSDDEELF